MGAARPFERDRKDLRYAAEIELHAAFGGRSLVTTTREISRGGLFFFADPTPTRGEHLRVTLHPDVDMGPISISAIVRHTLLGIGAGVEVTGIPAEVDRFRELVEDLKTRRAWAAANAFARDENGNVIWPLEHDQKEMIEVGEGGEAYRLLFERYPAVPLDRANLPGNADVLARARLILSGISTDSLGLKLNARDRLRRVRLGVLSRTQGYVAIVPPLRPGDAHSFYSLSGREQLMIRERGKLAYPFFGSRELARIREKVASGATVPAIPAAAPPPPMPGLSRGTAPALAPELDIDIDEDVGAAAAGPGAPGVLEVLDESTGDLVQSEHEPPSLSQWTRYNSGAERAVGELFELFDAETRVYQVRQMERRVRLLRHLTVMVRRDGSEEQREATLLHDGKRVCVLFGIKSRDAMTIRPLTREDEIRLPAL